MARLSGQSPLEQTGKDRKPIMETEMYLQYGKYARAAGFTAWLYSAADRLARRLGRYYRAYEGHRTARALATLDERTLRDIGLSKADVERAYYTPVFQDPRVDLEIARFNRINSRRQRIRRGH